MLSLFFMTMKFDNSRWSPLEFGRTRIAIAAASVTSFRVAYSYLYSNRIIGLESHSSQRQQKKVVIQKKSETEKTKRR